MRHKNSRQRSPKAKTRGRALFSTVLVLLGFVGGSCKPILGLKEKSGCNRCVNSTTQLVCDGSNVSERACPQGQLCSNTTGECDYPVVSLAASSERACAVKSDGSIWCWGTPDDLKGNCEGLRPTKVDTGGARATAVVVGALHACAIFQTEGGAGGEVRCWGGNIFGELGNGSTAPATTCQPTPVPGVPPTVTKITAGFGHTCALANGGEIYCWGANNVGQCGSLPANGDPTVAPGAPGSPCSGAAGTSTDAGVPDGGAQGTNYARAQRVAVTPTATAEEIIAKKNHTCVRSGTRLLCWGANCGGDGSDFTSIHCAYTDSAPAALVGTPAGGQLGLDPTQVCFSPTPHEIPPPSPVGWGKFALGFASTYAVPVGQTANVYAWGANGGSQLGTGQAGSAQPSSFTPALVRTSGGVLDGVKALVSSEGSDLCVALSSGTQRWRCWGTNNCGELGTAPPSVSEFAASAPSIPDDAVPELVARGDDYGCAVRASDPSAVVCWGALDSAGERDSGVGACDSRKPGSFSVQPVPVNWP